MCGILLGVLLVGVAWAADAPRLAPKGRRALWIWNPTFLENGDDFGELLKFTRKRRVQTLFLYASTRRLEAKPEVYRKFLERAHRANLVVHALNGSPEWTLREERSEPRAFLNAVFTFNRASRAAERFDAVHLDVEPQSLRRWTSPGSEDIRRNLAEQYLDLLKWARRKTSDEGLRLAVDIPVVFATIQLESRPLLAEVMEQVDEVAVMAYLDNTAEVLAGSRVPMEHATRMGKGVWVGLSADPEHLPRAKPGKKLEPALEKLAREVERSLAGRTAFRGVAIHDYDHYRRTQCKSLEKCRPDAPQAPAESTY
ncbi:MAG TPA: hypothetical protein VNK82_02120 [Terriglobales bacterium]|nr:hypothetical protein [Terriglobales bacterium]